MFNPGVESTFDAENIILIVVIFSY